MGDKYISVFAWGGELRSKWASDGLIVYNASHSVVLNSVDTLNVLKWLSVLSLTVLFLTKFLTKFCKFCHLQKDNPAFPLSLCMFSFYSHCQFSLRRSDWGEEKHGINHSLTQKVLSPFPFSNFLSVNFCKKILFGTI